MAKVKMIMLDLSQTGTVKVPRDWAGATDVDRADLGRFFHTMLLKEPRGCSGGVTLPHPKPIGTNRAVVLSGQPRSAGPAEKVRIGFQWAVTGATTGVAVWLNKDSVVGLSILLNGMESKDDLSYTTRLLRSKGFAVPETWAKVIDLMERPLNACQFYSHHAATYAPLLTVMEIFAETYFDLFGTADWDKPEGEGGMGETAGA